ncbi:MAG: DUF188 domain-containing protein [Bacillota bacterium]
MHDDKNPKIIIDGDACPKAVMNIISNETQILGLRILVIASFNHNISAFEHIIVGNEPQAADLALINKTKSGDIVVTQDWGLAAMVLAKGGMCIAPNGYIYNKDKIDFMLEERHIKAKHRRSGGRTKGLPPRDKEDDERFRRNFCKLLESTLESFG